MLHLSMVFLTVSMTFSSAGKCADFIRLFQIIAANEDGTMLGSEPLFENDATVDSSSEPSSKSTFSISDLSQTIMDSQQEGNHFHFHFKPDVMNYFGNELFIDEMTESKTVTGVQVTFHDATGAIVQNEDGDLMQYTSHTRDVGHVLNLAQRESTFSYVTFDLALQSDAAFDVPNLYFHSPRAVVRSE